ncbi:hypothetical protein PIB30_017958 [Stylosanthes scabra]|uniref:NB-ARC domain-containing protein n=1 Tax=Stylosanthes scabra TaxID=79078 RepID=A0ABU6T8Z8_9FABA|nr:hypothetical protein [Stylosanthes scabra]
MLHEVKNRIKVIKSTVRSIYENKDFYGINEIDFKSGTSEGVGAEYLHRRRRDVEEKEVVGLVNESNVVIQKLKERDPNLNVVSIIGMGGLGKTTLAKKIYNKDEVRGMFSCCAWSYVSNDYIIRDLLLSLLKCLKSSMDECKDLSVEELKEKLHECLKGNKYLVVLDDIWKTQVWDELRGVFPDDKNGSRIIITSRLREVALYSKASFVYDLPFLDEEVSWKLFSKKIFGDKECPSDLEPLGRAMATNCKGLPLAIVVLAGQVAKKERSEREWRKIKDYVNWHLAQDKLVERILKLSYDDLPPELKPCFLYLGMYPEDYEIPVRILCQLWIAEGFIQAKEVRASNSPKPEDIADMYLDMLVERSLVQVASRRSDGGVKTCRIHDLLQDLCISESRENKFIEVCTELDANESNNPRRMSLQYRKRSLPAAKDNQSQSHSHTRTLLYSESQGWNQISNGFKLVRVLDMNKVALHSFPSGLNTLIHLSKIWKLNSLKHIYIKYNHLSTILPRGGASMRRRMKIGETRVENIQTLGYIFVEAQTASLLSKYMFPNLTKVTLCGRCEEQEVEVLGKILPFLNKLRKLKLVNVWSIPLVPNVIPVSLIKITIRSFEHLHSRLIKTLGQLADLQILKLYGGHIYGGDVCCAAGDFPQLQVLKMNDVFMDNGRWKIEEGAMPCISMCYDPRRLLSN